MTDQITRYSDEELAEFKTLLEEKLSVATKELEYLRELIAKKFGDSKTGTETRDEETEKLIAMGQRQDLYIKKIEAALTRIGDKTYGICSATGKLIEKERLLAVPHTIVSAEAKNKEAEDLPEEIKPPKKERKKSVKKVRACRVCGCTQDNCQQCIEKTGSSCHWVEEDLCSACVPLPEEKIHQPAEDEAPTDDQIILKKKINKNDMNFFHQLHELIPGVDLSIVLKEKNGKYTMSLLPNVGNSTPFKPLLATGTPIELDERFFDLISKPLQESAALLKNAEAHKKSVEESVREKPAAAATKSSEKKDKKPVTKTPDKKAVKKDAVKKSKKEETKTSEPDLFAAAQ